MHIYYNNIGNKSTRDFKVVKCKGRKIDIKNLM